MIRCPQCGSEFEGIPERRPGVSQADVVICPHCSAECSRDGGEPEGIASSMVPVARFTNLAELGFFEELLSDNHVEMAVREINEFDAIHGQWNRRYILSVHEEDVSRAAELMQNQMGADDAHLATGEAVAYAEAFTSGAWDSETSPTYDQLDNDLVLDPAKLWVPVALVVLSGGLALWAMTSDPTPDVPQGKKLWDALSESNEPLQTLPGPGGETRRLKYDSRKRAFILQEDTDGDQRIDRERVFSSE